MFDNFMTVKYMINILLTDNIHLSAVSLMMKINNVETFRIFFFHNLSLYILHTLYDWKNNELFNF